jgi:hypothetical protein
MGGWVNGKKERKYKRKEGKSVNPFCLLLSGVRPLSKSTKHRPE